jgi:hypothetical protein
LASNYVVWAACSLPHAACNKAVVLNVFVFYHLLVPLQFALRLVNQDLAGGLDAFKWNRVNKHNKRLADKHYFTRAATKVGGVC